MIIHDFRLSNTILVGEAQAIGIPCLGNVLDARWRFLRIYLLSKNDETLFTF